MALTKAHNRMIAGAPVNVKDFGAVGDGVTDDTAAIQAALNSGSYSVFVPAVTSSYYIAGSTITIPDNVKLSGEGIKSKITCDASNRTNPATEHLFVVGSNCIIEDICVDGDRPNAVQEIRSFYIEAENSILFNNVTMSNHGFGIWVGESDNVKIMDCTFTSDTSKGHINTDGNAGYAQNLFIQGCYFGHTVEEAIDLNAKTRSVIIDSNTFYDNHTGSDIDGTEVIDIGKTSDCFDVVISNNRCNNNSAADAFVWCKLNSYNITITGNTVKNLKTSGGVAAFRISNASRISITGNTVQNATRALIVQERSSVIASEHLAFEANTISGVTQEAVFIDNCTGVTTNVVISGNTFDTTSSASIGIYVVEADKLVIANNTLSAFGNDGIVLNATVTNAIISNNNINGCSDGMSIVANGTLIQGNSVNTSAAFGIRLSATNCVVSGNNLINSAQSGLGLVGANNSCITGNICAGSTNFGVHVVTASSDVVLVGNMLANNTVSAIGSVGNLTGTPANANNVV